MNKRITLIPLSAGISLALLILIFVATKAASTINVIDQFNTTQTISTLGPSWTDSSSIFDISVLGGERDLQTKATNKVEGESVDVSTNSGGNNIYSHSQGSSTQGWSQIVWDGPDHDATAIDYTGLAGVDLTNGGLSDRFIFGIAYKNNPLATISMTVYTDKNNWSVYSIILPDPINSLTDFQIPYTDFTVGNGAAGPADFTRVGAVAFMVNGTSALSDGLYMNLQYLKVLCEYDFADLPETGTNYATTLGRNGPRHMYNGIILGNRIDFEADGQPDAHAGRYSGGDDFNGGPDDEDGVTLSSKWTFGSGGGPIDVTVTGGNGCLNGWIDWNNDGSMATTGDKVFTNVPVVPGLNHFDIDVPVDPNNQTFFALFRLTPRNDYGHCTATVYLTGDASGGEVESYEWSFGPTAIALSSLTAQSKMVDTTVLILASLGLLVLVALVAFTWLRRQRA